MDRPKILPRLNAIVDGGGSPADKAARAAQAVGAAGAYPWVGIYVVEKEALAALGWTGPTAPAHPRFPKSPGLSGAAACSGATVVVGDVTKDARYLTTFGSTRSEIVVPVRHPTAGSVLGLVDVESERPNAFTHDDQAFLEQCAAALAPLFE